MQKYLLTLLLNENLKEEEKKALLDSVTKKFGSLVKEDLWGLRSLSYPIKKQSKAFYAHFEFESEPSSIPSLDKSLKLDEDILRYLLVKSDLKVHKKKAKKDTAKKEETEEGKVKLDKTAEDVQPAA